MPKRIAVLGAGSWGLALTGILADNGHEVTVWEYNEDDRIQLSKSREHKIKLPGYILPDSVSVSGNLSKTVEGSDYLVMAVPAQKARSVVSQINNLPSDTMVVNVAKGIEVSSLKRMSQVISEELQIKPERIATLSGPSHAEEVVRDMPTTVVAASANEEWVKQILDIFSSDTFRVYKSDDLVGVELGGSLKNIIGIAAGIAAGLEMGDNTTGAILTRGLAEITRLGVAMGSKAETFAGLSGIGDLITTCVSKHSRNRFVGEQIGRGETLEQVLSKMTMVAEGVETTRSAYELAGNYSVEMPITEQVNKVLFENKSARVAVGELMGRSLKPEVWP